MKIMVNKNFQSMGSNWSFFASFKYVLAKMTSIFYATYTEKKKKVYM